MTISINKSQSEAEKRRFISVEKQRMLAQDSGEAAWRLWGPYLSERQWGTVREDYSEDGNAWDYFSHDQARSRAYRWGEDSIAGLCDEKQRLCLGLALWNEQDPILKERLFGLTNGEGNHGEDVKELYYYLDATPSHSYLKMLYKYPQQTFPYSTLIGTAIAAGTYRNLNCLTPVYSTITVTSTCLLNTRRPASTIF
jgi:hypothetical protein